MTYTDIDLPKVGIWFLFQGRLVAYSVPWNEGLEHGDFINGPVDHVHYWENIRKYIPGAKNVEYDEIPRGRVLLNKKDNVYYSYGSRKFSNDEKLKGQIEEEFFLPGKNTRHMHDDHYTK